MKKKFKKMAVCLTACSMLVGGVTVPVNAGQNNESPNQSIENQVENEENQATEEITTEEKREKSDWNQTTQITEEESETLEEVTTEKEIKRPDWQERTQVTEEQKAEENQKNEQEKVEKTTENTEEKATTKEQKRIKKHTKVTKVTCSSAGKVSISFKNKVSYADDVSAVITAEDGTEISCTVLKKSKKAIVISAEGLVQGQKYTITVQGVIVEDSTEAVSITKTFTVKGMKTKCKVVKVIVGTKNTITLKMKNNTYYKNATVTITNSDKEELETTIVKKARGKIKIKVKGLEKGEKYTVTVNGVKTKSEKNYSSVSKTLKVK